MCFIHWSFFFICNSSSVSEVVSLCSSESVETAVLMLCCYLAELCRPHDWWSVWHLWSWVLRRCHTRNSVRLSSIWASSPVQVWQQRQHSTRLSRWWPMHLQGLYHWVTGAVIAYANCKGKLNFVHCEFNDFSFWYCSPFNYITISQIKLLDWKVEVPQPRKFGCKVKRSYILLLFC
jgi:hypothetical protein